MVKPSFIVATTNYGLRTAEQQRPTEHVACPLPGCGRYVALTMSGYIEWHANRYGFTCDGVNFTPAQAARLQIDAAGRLCW